MNEVNELVANQHCADLLIGFFHHRDENRATEAATLFVEDGVWTKGDDGVSRGRAAIAATVGSGGRIRHLVSNVLVIDDGAGGRAATAYYAVYSGQLNVAGTLDAAWVGDCRATFVLQAGFWRIASLGMTRMFGRQGPVGRREGETP